MQNILPRQIPNKTNWGLDNISRYATQILICFIAYILQFLSLQCMLSPTIVNVIRMRLQQKTIKFPSIPCWEVINWGSAGMITLHELPWNWLNWQTKWIESINMSRQSIQGSSEWSHFLYLWVLLLHFILAPCLMPAAYVQQGHSRMFWCIQIWQLSELILLFGGLNHATRKKKEQS